MPKENLKTLYLEICFREAIESFVSYLEPLAEVSNFSNSIINQDAYNKMRDYVYDPSDVIYNQIKSVVVKYIEVWEFFYSTSIDLVDIGLKQWQPNQISNNYIRDLAVGVIYVVSFNSQGGSSVFSINAPIKSLITSPTAPTKSGSTFVGWYKEPTKTGLIATLATDTNSVTLTTGNTSGVIPGQLLTKTSGTGVFGTGARVGTITSATVFTVVDASGAALNHTTTGNITFTIESAWNFSTDRVYSNTTLYAKWVL